MQHIELANKMYFDPRLDDLDKDSIKYQILQNTFKGTYYSYIVVNTDGTTINDRITKFAIEVEFMDDKEPDLSKLRPVFVKSDVNVRIKNGFAILSKLIDGQDKDSDLIVNLEAFYKEGFPMMPDGDYPIYCEKDDNDKVIIAKIEHETEPNEDIEMKEANVGQIDIKGDCYVSDPTYSADTWCNYHLKNMVPGEYNCYCKMIDTAYGRIVAELRITHSDIDSDYESLNESNYIDLDNEHIGVDSGTCGFSISKPLNDGALLDRSVNRIIWNKINQSKYDCCVDKRYGIFSSSGFGDGDY